MYLWLSPVRRHAGLVCKSTIYYRTAANWMRRYSFHSLLFRSLQNDNAHTEYNSHSHTPHHHFFLFYFHFDRSHFFLLFPCIIFTYLNRQKKYQRWLKDKCQILKMAYSCSLCHFGISRTTKIRESNVFFLPYVQFHYINYWFGFGTQVGCLSGRSFFFSIGRHRNPCKACGINLLIYATDWACDECPIKRQTKVVMWKLLIEFFVVVSVSVLFNICQEKRQ